MKRLILVTLLAAGGAGVYVFASGSLTHESAPTQEEAAQDEWQVEYVDGEGNPLPRDRKGASANKALGRFKFGSKSLFKRGSSARPSADAAGGSGDGAGTGRRG
jgi:hypothetical protein